VLETSQTGRSSPRNAILSKVLNCCRSDLEPLFHPSVLPAPTTHQPRQQRCQAGASLGGEHPNLSRKARKLILLRAYSASGGLMPRSPLKDTEIVRSGPFCVNRWDRPRGRAERCQAGASLGGEHPNPSRKARKLILLRASSASGGLIPRSPLSERRPDAAETRDKAPLLEFPPERP